VAGVNSKNSQIGISDPYRDRAEEGKPGRVPAAHASPHTAEVHNDARYVSHDIYDVVTSDSPGGRWALKDYAEGRDIDNFIDQNWADDLLPYREPRLRTDLSVRTEIDYAVAVSPKMEDIVPPPTPTPTPTYGPTITGNGRRTPTPTTTGDGESTPTATASRTAEAQRTPTPTPADPCVDTYWMYHETLNMLGVTVHLLPNCDWENRVFDLHILIDEAVVVDKDYDPPMVVCNKYNYFYQLPAGVDFIEGGNLYMEGFAGGYPSTIWVELTCQAHGLLKKIKVPYREGWSQ